MSQENGVDCGMCIAGFALALALGLAIESCPTKFPADLRKRWHAAVVTGIDTSQFACLDNTFLATAFRL